MTENEVERNKKRCIIPFPCHLSCRTHKRRMDPCLCIFRSHEQL